MDDRPKPIPHSFQEGEVFYYLGEPYRLRLAEPHSSITVKAGWISVPRADTNQQMGEEIIRWYRQMGKEILLPRVKELSDRYGFHYTMAKITSAKTRWGSCSGKNAICLSWYLVMAPKQVADSVMIHELCHTIHHDHSHAFWSLVEQLMPDYQQHRQWLKENRYLMRFDIDEKN